jgi:hypothetical protein
MHTRIYTHTRTHEQGKRTKGSHQLALPTPTRTALTNKPAYSHECYTLLTKVPPLSILSRIPPLAYASPSHPRVTTSTAFSLALGPGIGPRRSVGACRPTAATLALTIGETPLPSGLAPFLCEFSEPPQEVTEWESAPFSYIRSCSSRFSSVFRDSNLLSRLPW